MYMCMYVCARGHLTILHHPGTRVLLSLSLSSSLSLSLILAYRSHIPPSVARDTRLVVRAYDVTRMDRRYLAAWMFSNGQIHATSSICESTRNCPTIPVITCWRSLTSAARALHDAKNKKNDIRGANRLRAISKKYWFHSRARDIF